MANRMFPWQQSKSRGMSSTADTHWLRSSNLLTKVPDSFFKVSHGSASLWHHWIPWFLLVAALSCLFSFQHNIIRCSMAFKSKMFEMSQSFLLISLLTAFQILNHFTEMFRRLELMKHIDLRLLCAWTAEYLVFKVGLISSFLFEKQCKLSFFLFQFKFFFNFYLKNGSNQFFSKFCHKLLIYRCMSSKVWLRSVK